MKPKFDELDKVIETQGTKAKIKLLTEIVKDDDTREFLNILYNDDVYDIADISIDKVIDVSTELFIDDKVSIKEQLNKMKFATGNRKIEILKKFFSYTPMNERIWFKRLLLKDFQSVGVKTYNKALKNSGYKPIDLLKLQLCQSITIGTDGKVLDWNGLDVTKKNMIQKKSDGSRIYIIKNNQSISATSRNDKDIPNVNKLKQYLYDKFPNDDFIIDGELIDINDDFNVVSKKIRAKKEISLSECRFVVFDIIKLNGTLCTNLPQIKRFELLENYFSDDEVLQIPETFIVTGEENIMAIYNRYISQGFEGIVAKTLDGLYEYDSRKYWWKLKPVSEATFEIFDVEIGSGKNQGKISALWIRDRYDCIKCKVGSGLTEIDIEKLTAMGRDEIIGKFVEVFYTEILKKGLRFPRFKAPNSNLEENLRWRDDIEEADDLIPIKAKMQKIKEKNKKFEITKPKVIEW